jgi:hypothetical protein
MQRLGRFRHRDAHKEKQLGPGMQPTFSHAFAIANEGAIVALAQKLSLPI